jgi:hypothetical protein
VTNFEQTETTYFECESNEVVIAAALIQTLGTGAIMNLEKNLKRIAKLSVEMVKAIQDEKAKQLDNGANYGV